MTSRDLHNQASNLFLDLRELTPSERDSRLNQLTDPALKREVLELLANDIPTHVPPNVPPTVPRASEPTNYQNPTTNPGQARTPVPPPTPDPELRPL